MRAASRLTALVLIVLAAGIVRAAAEPVRYRVDPAASAITFRATSRLQTADGRFHRFRGDVHADPRELTAARVELVIDAASIDTGNRRRDTHLRSEDFFWVERHGDVRFESARVEHGGAGRLVIAGRLTMRGIVREVTVPVDVDVSESVVTARGELLVNRKDYGISYNSFLNPIDDTVRVAFRFHATRE
jgi:polyisoprenoid-binding protein YceI